MRFSGELFFFSLTLFDMVPRGLTQSETPFCDVCICTWFQNESPTINCISRNVPNIYDPKYWHDRMDNPYSMKAIIVNYNKLESLNTTFPFSNLKQLDLSRNDIKKIENGVFGRLQEMNTLILSRNKLEYINPHTFKGGYEKSSYFPLRSLKRLDLEYNELHTLDADTFEHIDELEELNLSHNPLRVIDAQTVQALTSLVYLKTLNLAYTQLQNLPEFFLHTPKYLRSLDLSGNLFESVPNALEYSRINELFFNQNPLRVLRERESFPDNLTSLHMNHMPALVKIGSKTFTQCPKLYDVHLSDNRKLSMIETDAFVNLPLVNVILNDNNLTSLDEGLVSNWSRLERLELSGNPWNCNCSLRWMLNVREDITFLGKLRCASPPEMKTFTFYDLAQNQSGIQQCPKIKEGVNKYVTILVILCSILLVIMFLIVFYIRRKRVSGPKFHVIVELR